MIWKVRTEAPPTPLGRSLRGLFLVAALMAPLMVTRSSHAKPKVHVVYQGQRLGSIAKRYNVSIDELCRANGITRTSTIRPGQKLIVPGTDDGTGSSGATKKDGKSNSTKDAPPPRPQGKAAIHVVAKGHTLSAIAGRYAVTVTALCNANGFARNTTLSVGQKLIVPHKTDKEGLYARRQRLNGHFDDDREDDREASKADTAKSWEPYVKSPWRRGYIKIRRYGRYWAGYVIGPGQEVLGLASNKINFVLGASKDGPRIDPRLVRLIASVSDKFGGREMRIVSGYRTKSFVAASQHKVGRALDFSIPGVPNEVLRDYLRTLEDVGVGYYPNSSFVHVDVRGYNSYWVDYAGPGESPRKHVKRKAKPSPDGAEHDHDTTEVAVEDQTYEDGSSEEDGTSGSSAPDDAVQGDAADGDGPSASKGDEGAASGDDDKTASKAKSGAPTATKDERESDGANAKSSKKEGGTARTKEGPTASKSGGRSTSKGDRSTASKD